MDSCLENCVLYQTANALLNRLHTAYDGEQREREDWLDDLCAREMIDLEDALVALEEVCSSDAEIPHRQTE